jgi:hypothetical protein
MQMDRACLYPYMCEGLRARLPSSLNAADIFGCPMRIALEPKTSFLDTSINFWAEGAMSPMSVAQAAQLMAKYFVISIHFRLGDDWAFHHTAQSERQDLTLPFKCAQTVQSFAEKRPLAPTSSHAAWKEDMDLWQPGDDERLVDGRPVRCAACRAPAAAAELTLGADGSWPATPRLCASARSGSTGSGC